MASQQGDRDRLQRWGGRIRDELARAKALPPNVASRQRTLRVLQVESRQYLEALLAADMIDPAAFDREAGKLEQVYDELLKGDFEGYLELMGLQARRREIEARRAAEASMQQDIFNPRRQAPGPTSGPRRLPTTELPVELPQRPDERPASFVPPRIDRD